MPKTSHLCRASLTALLLLGLWVTAPAADDVSDCQSPDPEARIRACTNLLKTRKLDGDNRSAIYLFRGIGYARIGSHDLAIEDFGQAMKIIPHRSDPYYLRGVSRAATGKVEGAIADFDAAIARDPNHADALTYRGKALLEIGDVDPAIADFTEAIAKGDPPDAFFGRARAYMQKREFALAIDDLDVVIGIVPNNPELLYHRGVAHAEAGNLDAALADFGRVLAINPDSADVYDARGQIHAQAGNDAQAIADFDAAIARDPGRVDFLHHRARAHMRTGEAGRAIADYNAAIAAARLPDAETFYGRALAYMSEGEPRRAIVDLNAALAILPDHPGLLYHRGVAYADAGDLDAAIADYNKVVEIQPDHPEVYYYRGVAYWRKGAPLGKAAADFDRMLEINPDHAGALNYRELAQIAALESGADLLCVERSAVARIFPPAPEGWSVDAVDVAEIEPATREFEVFMEALGGLAAGRAINETPRVRLRAVRNYSTGDKAIKVIIDTEDLEGLGLIAAAHENDDVKAELAAKGFEAERVRGQRALVASSGAAIRVGENGLISLECDGADCDTDLMALVERIDLDAVEKFAACEHRAEPSAAAE